MKRRTKRKLTQSEEFDKDLAKAFQPLFRRAARKPEDSGASDAIKQALQAALDDAATRIVKQMDSGAAKVLRNALASKRGFERRLSESWSDGLRALEQLLIVNVEYGSEYYASGLAQKPIRMSAKFRVLCGLHARSCRVAREVQALILAGLPDGALARWRTLHEIAVVALVIAQEEGSDSRKISRT